MKKSIFLFFAAILCAMTANAYNQEAVDLYFDNSTSQWANCYVSVGHTSWTAFYDMERVSGTQYLWKLPANFNGGNSWGGALGWVVSVDKWEGYPKNEDITVKYVWHGDKNVTKLQTNAWVNSKIYKADGTESVSKDNTTKTVYKVTSYTNSNYTVTINTVTGGTLTVKDYDNNAVATGASKIHLTVLKFSAAPASGYVFDGVQINDGSTTTTISASEINTKTHTLTSNVTITPVWKATTSTVTVTTNATNGTVTGAGVYEEGTSVTLTATADAGYQFKNWTVAGAEVSTANPYTFTANTDITVTANFEELPKETVYFVNADDWTGTIYAYAYANGGSTKNAEWPGEVAQKEANPIGGHDVYSYTAEKDKYENVIFNNKKNGGEEQTADLTWADGAGKYYVRDNWYTKEEAEAKLAAPVDDVTVYFINTAGWDEVACHHWLEGVSGTTWPGDVMTKETEQIAGYDVYTLTFTGEHPKCIFNNNKESGASQTGDLDVQDGKYYALSTETWYDTPEAAAEALAVPIPDVTVYFVNTKSWTTVNAYVFAGSNSYKGWPGEAMTKTGDQAHGYDVYSYTFPETYTSCIFNNGSTQTEDLTTNAGQYYDMASTTWYATLAEVPNPTPPVMETVYFINTGEWEKVHVHAWKDATNNGWPGAELAKNGETVAGFDVYSFEAEQGQWANIIFNCGGDECKTGNLTWEAGKYYAHSTGEWYDTPEAAETALATPVEDVYTVVGSPTLCGSDWDATDTSNDMTLVDGLYVWTKENVTLTGNTTFKIVKNHDYGQGEWPSGYGANATIDISTSDCTEGGTYSIKITFDPTTGTITPTIESCEAAEEPIVHTYTVVGQAVLCESDWNISDATNDMTLVDGLYVWTKENVELRSNAEFRIVKDHAYDEAYPSGNYVIDLANYEGAAIYNVTITFNAETKEITVAMEKTGDVTPVVYTYYLMGVNGDWTTGIEMVRNEANTDAEEYMLTCQPVNGEVKIKRLGDDASEHWYGAHSLKAEEGNLGTNTSTDGGDGNIFLEEGIYNFYFNTADGKLWIAVATDCAIEITEEYDITITNLETEVPQPGFLALLGSESEVLGLSVQLFLNDYTGENKEYQLNEVSYITSDYVGELTFVSGSMTQEDYGTDAKIYTGTLIVELQGQYFQFNMTMYKKQLPTKTLTITGADLVVDLWNNITITAVHNSAPVLVQFSDFEYVASKEYTYLMLEVGEWVDEDGDGVCDNVDYISEMIEEATVTISGSTFTLKSKFEGTDANYDLTITGTLPLIIGEGDNSSVLAQNGQTADAYISRTFESGNLYTVSFPFAMNETTTKNVFGSRVEVYEYTSLTEETDGLVLNFTKLSTPQIAAGTPYLVKPNRYAYGFGLSDVTISNANNPVTYTCANTTIAMEPVLTVAANAKTNGKTQYWLAEDNYLYNKSVNLKGLRAIFNVQTNKSNVRARAAFNENVETGVEDIFSTDAPVKVIENGQLIIIRDGVKYNVQGQKL